MTTLRHTPGVQTVRVPVPAGWATAGTASDAPAFVAPYDLEVVAVRLVTDAAFTGHATNYATIALNNGATAIASRATDTPTTDDAAALSSWDVTLSTTAADLLVDEGTVLDIEKTIAASGVAVSGTIEVDFYSRG